MERDKYIQWTVEAGHISHTPLGYRVDLSRDRTFTDLIFSRSTFSDTGEFEYDPTGTGVWETWPRTGIDSPSLSTPVRFNYSHGHSVGFAMVQDNTLYSVRPDGGGIEASLPLETYSNPSISVDSENGDFWLHDSGRDTILVVSQSLVPIRSLITSPLCVGIVRDGIRDLFWEIHGDEMLIRSSGGKTLGTHSLPETVESVSGHHVCRHTGDLLLLCETAAGNLFLHTKRRTGVYFSNTEAYSSISYKGPSSVYLSKTSGLIYEYSETSGIDSFLDLSSKGITPNIIRTHGDADFFVLDRTVPEILKLSHPSGDIAWRISIPTSIDMDSYYFDVHFQASSLSLPLHFWSRGTAGTICDFPLEPSLTGVIYTEETPVSGCLRSFKRPAHIWTKISTATESTDNFTVNLSSSSSVSSQSSSSSSVSSISSSSSSSSSVSSTSSSTESSSSVSSTSLSSTSSSLAWFNHITISPSMVTGSGNLGPGYEEFNLFDNIIPTCNYPLWENQYEIWMVDTWTSTSINEWVQVDFGLGNEKTINHYWMHCFGMGVSPGDSNTCSNRDHTPSGWTFEGSNNGTSWDVLDTQVSQAWPFDQGDPVNDRVYENIGNVTAYRYYKFHFTEKTGGSLYLGISEIDLSE